MGWTSYHASHYKYSGRRRIIDRKAEMDEIFKEEDCLGGAFHVRTLKSAMVGSTYYAAIERTQSEHPENRVVFAVVCLTSTNMKEYYNFAYKDMDETCGPYKYDCPKAILDLLTPTDSEWANNWRQRCRENIANKAKTNALTKLPVGTVIKVIAPREFKIYKKGDEMILTKRRVTWKRSYFCDDRYYYHNTQLGNDYEIVRKAVGNV